MVKLLLIVHLSLFPLWSAYVYTATSALTITASIKQRKQKSQYCSSHFVLILHKNLLLPQIIYIDIILQANYFIHSIYSNKTLAFMYASFDHLRFCCRTSTHMYIHGIWSEKMYQEKLDVTINWRSRGNASVNLRYWEVISKCTCIRIGSVYIGKAHPF